MEVEEFKVQLPQPTCKLMCRPCRRAVMSAPMPLRGMSHQLWRWLPSLRCQPSGTWPPLHGRTLRYAAAAEDAGMGEAWERRGRGVESSPGAASLHSSAMPVPAQGQGVAGRACLHSCRTAPGRAAAGRCRQGLAPAQPPAPEHLHPMALRPINPAAGAGRAVQAAVTRRAWRKRGAAHAGYSDV